mmetsp:Transcript_110769/g.217128  ORF Transcript_110769/g.217128 Transcript_110769/m.217128 type:complete len:215 (-) Transcript_110769:277-921(-)
MLGRARPGGGTVASTRSASTTLTQRSRPQRQGPRSRRQPPSPPPLAPLEEAASFNELFTFSTRSCTFLRSSSLGLTSCSHRSAQFARLLPKLSPSSRSVGHKRIVATKSGAIMNSMKPTWELGLLSFSRSFKNCTGMPKIFSWSPWAKNSSKHTIAHACDVSHTLQGLDTSAAWRMVSITSILVPGWEKTSATARLLPSARGASAMRLKTSWSI